MTDETAGTEAAPSCQTGDNMEHCIRVANGGPQCKTHCALFDESGNARVTSSRPTHGLEVRTAPEAGECNRKIVIHRYAPDDFGDERFLITIVTYWNGPDNKPLITELLLSTETLNMLTQALARLPYELDRFVLSQDGPTP